jgi:TetR/AcrR family transcriptional regulator
MAFNKKFEHSQELFEAALDEFILRGYENASLNTILDHAGMSKGQFYYHFKNKEGLYLALIDRLITQKKDFLANVMKPEDFNQDIFSVFKTHMKYSLEFAVEYPLISQFSESFLREKGNAIYQKTLSVHNFENNEYITGLVRRALETGQFRSDMPPEFIQKLIGYLFTHVADLAELSKLDQFEASVDLLVDFIQYGLAKQPTCNTQ